MRLACVLLFTLPQSDNPPCASSRVNRFPPAPFAMRQWMRASPPGAFRRSAIRPPQRNHPQPLHTAASPRVSACLALLARRKKCFHHAGNSPRCACRSMQTFWPGNAAGITAMKGARGTQLVDLSKASAMLARELRRDCPVARARPVSCRVRARDVQLRQQERDKQCDLRIHHEHINR